MAKRRRFSQEETERGLTALILAATSEEASQLTGIPASTLRDWKSERRETYDRLCDQLEPQLVKRIAAGAEDLALAIEDRERAIIISLTDEEIARLEPKDKAATLRNLSTSKALQLDKVSSPLRERPSHVQQGMDIEGLMMRAARALGMQHVANQAAIESSVVALPSESGVLNAHDQGHSSTELEHHAH